MVRTVAFNVPALTLEGSKLEPTNRATAQDVIMSLVEWLDGSGVRCLDEKVVPGTTSVERRRLAALGGVVRSIARHQLAMGILPSEVRTWVESAPPAPGDLADRIAEALRINGVHFLANIYEAIVESTNRRRLGTYFTPQATVDWLLAEWSKNEAAPAAVVDVGAGVGVFTASALRRWPACSVTAVDVNPVTLGLLAALPMLAASQPERLRLVLQDYTEWEGSKEQAPCITIGNPPYTRLQLLPQAARARLRATIPDCGTRAGLSTWIAASAFSRLREQDGLLLLLPRNWIEADYAIAFRERLWAASSRRVELTCLDGDLFGDARVDAVALLVGTQQPGIQPFILRDNPGAPESITTNRAGRVPSFVPQRRTAPRYSKQNACDAQTRPLGSFGTVRRGVATGANDFFTLSDEAVRERRLPPASVHPLVRRLRDFDGNTIHEADWAALDERAVRWLFLIREAQMSRGVAVGAYVSLGEEIGISRRHLCSKRKPWYDLHCDTTIPDVIVGAMSSGRFRFVENSARAAITNNLFGFTWLASTTAAQRTAILTWLRSNSGQDVVRAACRIQAGGLRKLEPRALSEIRVPLSALRNGLTQRLPKASHHEACSSGG